MSYPEYASGPVAFLFVQNFCDPMGKPIEELQKLLEQVHTAVRMLPEDLFEALRDCPRGTSSLARSAVDEVRCNLRLLAEQAQVRL